MAIKSVWCHVLGAKVTRITDLGGAVTRIICPEYDDAKGVCRLSRDAVQGGPLARLLERVEENTLESRSFRCDMR